jgi:hypothetical protein
MYQTLGMQSCLTTKSYEQLAALQSRQLLLKLIIFRIAFAVAEKRALPAGNRCAETPAKIRR